MSEQVEYRVVEQVAVAADGTEEVWSLEQRLGQDSWWTLVLTAPGGATWTGAGQGLWSAFLDLRHQTDRLGYRLCCAGARIDANMRSGRLAGSDVVDILSRRTLLGIRHKSSMLAYAPASRVGTVEDQEARYERWLATPWWRAFWPGDVTR
jgi:hypothetical protein